MRGQQELVTLEMSRSGGLRRVCSRDFASSQDVHVLLLCRDRLAAWVFAQSLPPCVHSTHSEAAEEALHHGRLSGYSFALVDCDMPDGVFRRLHGYGHPDRGKIRVIGLRGRDPWRPMRLLAERMISSYVRMPMPIRMVHALIGHRPLAADGMRTASSICSNRRRRGAA